MIKLVSFLIAIFFTLTSISYAYLGIAPLIPLIGQAVVFIFLAVVIFFGVIFYPFKLLYNKIKRKKVEKSKDK
tara:strand:+ start:128 stop:346 length:219 start_codon:yes stop_codon:yes gene_type:complete